ncbi:hypothetical protein [Nocardia colli]|uniref:hypothetical protein n=1 Tax=Nocardia colli TaxID=2545717 RepID=UPI0035D66B24
MATIPTGEPADHLEQLTAAYTDDSGWDTSMLTPAPEFLRAGVDPADVADRIDQAWITPLPDDDYRYGPAE